VSEIEVMPLHEGAFGVKVTEGDVTTDHRVTVPPALVDDLGLGGAEPEAIVRESIAFLLEREPATSILPEFSLDEVGRYFPEFTSELPRRLQG
jgi:hypothetical protein